MTNSEHSGMKVGTAANTDMQSSVGFSLFMKQTTIGVSNAQKKSLLSTSPLIPNEDLKEVNV